MACACSKTSPSRHPPLTEPAIFPDWLIAIREPAGRGALPHVLITVATATGSPASSHALTSLITSRTSQSVVSPVGRRMRPFRSGSRRDHKSLPSNGTAVCCLEQQGAERFEIGKIVRWQKVGDEGQCRLEAKRQRFITRRAHQRVHPDQAVAGPLEPGDGLPHLGGIAPVPTIADQGDGGTAAQHPTRVAAVEGLDRLT